VPHRGKEDELEGSSIELLLGSSLEDDDSPTELLLERTSELLLNHSLLEETLLEENSLLEDESINDCSSLLPLPEQEKVNAKAIEIAAKRVSLTLFISEQQRK
jgi:hypothetical protein